MSDYQQDTWLQALIRSRILEGKQKGRKRAVHRFPRIRWMYPWAIEQQYARLIQNYLDKLFAQMLPAIEANWDSWIPKRATFKKDEADWATIRATMQKQKTALVDGGMGKAINLTGEAIEKMNSREWQKFVNSIGGQQFYAPEDFSKQIAAWEDLNMTLLESLGEEQIKKVNAAVSNGIMAGKSWKEVAQEIQGAKLPPSRAKFIARDQTGKLNGVLARERQLDAGVAEYEWSTSLDERVRSTHSHLHGKICRWDDPTVYKENDKDDWKPRTSSMFRGHPGDDYQCRCAALPHIGPVWDAIEKNVYQEKPQAVLPPPVKPAEPALPPPVAPVVPKPARKTRTKPASEPVTVAPAVTVPGFALPAGELTTEQKAIQLGQSKDFLKHMDWTKYSDSSWKNVDPSLKAALLRAETNLSKLTTDGKHAYYDRGRNAINMDHSFPATNGKGQSCWRHEYGHHLDQVMGGGRGTYWSRDGLGTQMAADKKAWKKGRFADAKNTKTWNEFRRELGTAKADAIEALWVEAHGQDSFHMISKRMLEAALNGYMEDYSTVFTSRLGSAVFDKTSVEYAEVCKLNDILAAHTKANIGFGHSAEYFKSDAQRPATEVFANLTSMLNGPNREQWRFILSKVIPQTTEQYISKVQSYGAYGMKDL